MNKLFSLLAAFVIIISAIVVSQKMSSQSAQAAVDCRDTSCITPTSTPTPTPSVLLSTDFIRSFCTFGCEQVYFSQVDTRTVKYTNMARGGFGTFTLKADQMPSLVKITGFWDGQNRTFYYGRYSSPASVTLNYVISATFYLEQDPGIYNPR